MDSAPLKRENFASILKRALDSMENLSNSIVSEFVACCLSPFSPDAVDYIILKKTTKNKVRDANVLEVQRQQKENLPSTNSEEQYAKKHLKYIESRLSSQKLLDFQNVFLNNTLNISNKENQGLFKLWLTIRNLSGENTSYVEGNFLDVIDNEELRESITQNILGECTNSDNLEIIESIPADVRKKLDDIFNLDE